MSALRSYDTTIDIGDPEEKRREKRKDKEKTREKEGAPRLRDVRGAARLPPAER